MVAIKRQMHAHGCIHCRGRYEDNCANPDGNDRCRECQGRLGWAVLALGREPRDCCVAHSRPASKPEQVLYRLSRGCSWWICGVCARTQPLNPANVYGDAP